MHRPQTIILPAAILASFLLAGLGFTAAQSMVLAAPESAIAETGSTLQPLQQPDNSDLLTVPVIAASQEPAACLPGSRYPENITRWCDLILESAEQSGLAVDLIAALMLQESGGDPLAYSVSGAVGLLQVMPRDGLAEAFQCINGPCFASRPSIDELQDPQFNLMYGSQMLSGLLNRAGDLREALKAYGPMDVEYAYADTVLAIREKYR